ncbi:MAG TPA: hypothetical protein VF444_03010 [Pseudonocardiaceae bacterium]
MGEAEDVVQRRLDAASAAREAEQQRQQRKQRDQQREANKRFRELLPKAVANLRRRDYEVLLSRTFLNVAGEKRVAWEVDSADSSTWYILADGTIVKDDHIVDGVPSMHAVNSLQRIAIYPREYREAKSLFDRLGDWLEMQGIIPLRNRR